MTPNLARSDAGLLLAGLDGSNPLAFLAALGTLRTLSHACPDRDVKMCWVEHSGAWRPVIVTRDSALSDGQEGQQRLLAALQGELAQQFADHPLARADELMRLEAHLVRQKLQGLCGRTELDSRKTAATDWLSAISSDCAPDATSQLQIVRRDYFIGNLTSITQRTTYSHLHRALFQPWDYADALHNQSLHWDPSEDRRHALQWNKPSGDPARKKSGGMLGANRLAIEAIPLFQSIAVGDKLSTCGFSGTRADNTRWTWPIWTCPLGCEPVFSLLAMCELQADCPNAEAIRAMGIASVYRCRRILVEKTPNFTPARAV